MAKTNTNPAEDILSTQGETAVAAEESTVIDAAELTEASQPAAEVESSTLAQASPNKIEFTTEGLDWSLEIMGKGMLGIFIVTAIIVTVTVILNKATAPRKKKEKKNKGNK